MNDEIMVSVVCNAFNHGKYIESALKGFIAQETDFRFEVLVHDDCSKDDTAAVIRRYEEQYPELILPIYQQENQVTKGKKVFMDFQLPRARGKYIAFCEGDDYWIDPRKLQKQVDYMEAHPDCTFCFTNAKCETDGKIVRDVIPWNEDSVVLEGNVYDVDAIERINFIPTVTFLFRRESVAKLPKLRSTSFAGDGYYKVCFTSQGYAYYIPECTAVYRYGVPGSSTTSWKQSYAALERAANRFISMFEDLDQYFDGKYPIFRDRITNWEIEKYFATGEFEKLRGKKYKEYYKQHHSSGYPVFLFAVTFPKLYGALRRMKNGKR